MVYLLIGGALVVFGLAAVAGSGRLGEMPDPVDDRFAGRFPEELSPETVTEVRFSRAPIGYERAAVDKALATIFDDPAPPSFQIMRGGYQIGQVDWLFDRVAQMRNNRVELVQDEMRDSNGSDEATNR